MVPIQTNSSGLHQHTKGHLLNFTVSKSLTDTLGNLKELYNLDIKLQVTTKNVKKEDRLCIKFSAHEALFARRTFKIRSLFLVLTFQIIYQYPI